MCAKPFPCATFYLWLHASATRIFFFLAEVACAIAEMFQVIRNWARPLPRSTFYLALRASATRIFPYFLSLAVAASASLYFYLWQRQPAHLCIFMSRRQYQNAH